MCETLFFGGQLIRITNGHEVDWMRRQGPTPVTGEIINMLAYQSGLDIYFPSFGENYSSISLLLYPSGTDGRPAARARTVHVLFESKARLLQQG